MDLIASTSAWKNDLDAALGGLASLGFSEVDLIVIESWGLVSLKALLEDEKAETERVRSLLRHHGLRARSLNTAFSPAMWDRSEESRQQRQRELEVLLRFMRELGIDRGTHYPGHIADWKNDPEGVWRATTDSLREIHEALPAEGPRLCPELHFKTPYETPLAGRRLREEIPGLTYTYEPSHYIVNGWDYRETADLLDGASHIHFRGCAEGRLQAPPEVAEEALGWVLERLRARSYNGILSIEYLPDADFNVEEAIRNTRAFIGEN